MKLDTTLEFEAEVVEQQRLLNGAEYLSLQGQGEGIPWSLSLSFERPKESGAAMTDGDLTLTAPQGVLFAGLESGRADIVIDEIAGDEQTTLKLSFQIHGGEGDFEDAAGAVALQGEIAGAQASLRLTLSLEPGAAAS